MTIDRSQDNFLRMPEVCRRTGLSSATIDRMIVRGEFPAKVKLSINAVAWYEGDVNRWIADPAGWAQAA